MPVNKKHDEFHTLDLDTAVSLSFCKAPRRIVVGPPRCQHSHLVPALGQCLRQAGQVLRRRHHVGIKSLVQEQDSHEQ